MQIFFLSALLKKKIRQLFGCLKNKCRFLLFMVLIKKLKPALDVLLVFQPGQTVRQVKHFRELFGCVSVFQHNFWAYDARPLSFRLYANIHSTVTR